jgi:hypothetical protein
LRVIGRYWPKKGTRRGGIATVIVGRRGERGEDAPSDGGRSESER